MVKANDKAITPPDGIRFSDPAEMLKLLRGEYYLPPICEPHGTSYTEPMPTDTFRVLTLYVYANPAHQEAFSAAMLALANGSADDVYLAVSYLQKCMICEKHGMAGFLFDPAPLAAPLREGILRHEEALAAPCCFASSAGRASCRLRFIQAWNEHIKSYYGLSVLDEDEAEDDADTPVEAENEPAAD